jgi:hypothetical protein
MRLLHRALLLAAVATRLSGQSNLAAVEGKVVDANTGAPVKRAIVRLRMANGLYNLNALTDVSGAFHIDGAQPGKYAATASADGYVSSASTLFTAEAGAKITGVEVRIAPLGVIAGKILDENDEPMAGVSVMAVRYVHLNGAKVLQPLNAAQSDDRGLYRMFDLQPGRYFLVATARSRMSRPNLAQGGERIHSTVPEVGYGMVIYPGVTAFSETAPHEMKAGAEWSGVNFKLHTRPEHHIRGRVVGGPQGGRANVQAEYCDEVGVPNAASASFSRQDGTFDILAVTGNYCLTVREPGRSGIALRQPVTLKDDDINGLTLAPPASFSVKGTVFIDGTPPSGAVGRLRIGLRRTGPNQDQAAAANDLTFQIDNIFPGEYRVEVQGTNQLYIKSMTYGANDITGGVIANTQPGTALTIVLGADPGSIQGTVQPGVLEPGTPLIIAAIPDDGHAARSDLYHSTQSAADGSFALAALPPGDYKLYALQSQDSDDADDRDLLKLLEGSASAVTVHAGMTEQVHVVPVPAAEIERAKGKEQ